MLVSDVMVGVSMNSDANMPNYLSFLSKDSHYQEKVLALGVMKEARASLIAIDTSVLIVTSVSCSQRQTNHFDTF